MTQREYQKLAARKRPASPVAADCAWAFCVGGLLCAAGQLSADLLRQAGMPLPQARLTASLILVTFSVLATVLHVYDDVGRRAGAGLSVPITGFANSIAAAAIEFKSEGLVLGMAAKMFVIAGPVLVYGMAASVLYGLIYWVVGLF
ncbi:MAG: SpoVA/SpoVAEb family sporulation membrane protein [Clostridia bacterium]|nr:SpoVA/SpoVAEb family sporulation membrane protein [Clostridia bacterium]